MGRWRLSSVAASTDSLTAVLSESLSLTPEQIAAALSDFVPGEELRYVDGWERPRSGTTFFRFSVEPSGRMIVVKSGRDWTAEDASRLYQAQTDLARAISEPPIEHAGSMRPVGWITRPPSIVMPYVGGSDVVSILRDPSRPEWESMATWVKAAGAMLAAYHASNPMPPAEAELEDVLDVGRRMRIGAEAVSRMLERAGWEKRCASSYGDFGPGNLIGVLDGPVFLIDPPVDTNASPAHRDLGNFVFELRRQLEGHGHTRSDPVPGRFEDLREALLAGYSERSGSPLEPADLPLVTLYEMRRAAGMARKRLSTRPTEAVWFARSALARRREILAGLRHPE